MKPLYTTTEFECAKSTEKLPLECVECGKTFTKQKRVLKRTNYTHEYCSSACSNRDKVVSFTVACKQCGKKLSKMPSETNPSGNYFCNRSCAATYNNTHKTKGSRRSKLEVWLEEKLSVLYPSLTFEYCGKTHINSELDIYVPSLKLAFELNGIYHYEPIHGEAKLNQVQNNDGRKFQACIEAGISLCIIDASKLSYFKEKNCLPYLGIVTKVIDAKMREAEHTV